MTPYETAVWADKNAGVKLEIVRGMPTWEAFPAVGHQRRVDTIRDSIRPAVADGGAECGCVHYADVYIRFPDGSLKRPDISLFCREPDEQETAVTLLPEAVIEIISPGYEAKDLTIGVPFYLTVGVADILVVEPDTNQVRHFRPGQPDKDYTSPVTLTLTCGCEITL